VEISPLAVEQFFSENELQPEMRESPDGRHYIAGNIEIFCGDIFAMDAASLAACAAVYDRAALVALPATMRAHYVDHVYGQLSSQYRGLLLTLEYPQEQMDGPPFSLDEAEVRSLYAAHSHVETIDRRGILDKEPKFAERGLTRLDTAVYRLSASRP
jgi:thiopurine S-methyltransferase